MKEIFGVATPALLYHFVGYKGICISEIGSIFEDPLVTTFNRLTQKGNWKEIFCLAYRWGLMHTFVVSMIDFHLPSHLVTSLPGLNFNSFHLLPIRLFIVSVSVLLLQLSYSSLLLSDYIFTIIGWNLSNFSYKFRILPPIDELEPHPNIYLTPSV